MSQIKLKHSGGNGVIIAAPSSNPAADRTLLLPGDGDSTIDTLGRAGNFLQVVQESTTTQVTNTTTTYSDTNLSATITPTSSSNKILICISQQMLFQISSSGGGAGINILRGSTEIHSAPQNSIGAYSHFVSGGGITSLNLHFTYNLHYLDSPNTTSATTYKTQAKLYEAASSAHIISQFNSTVDGTSYMTLMEVAA